jgi:hypothetical protein
MSRKEGLFGAQGCISEFTIYKGGGAKWRLRKGHLPVTGLELQFPHTTNNTVSDMLCTQSCALAPKHLNIYGLAGQQDTLPKKKEQRKNLQKKKNKLRETNASARFNCPCEHSEAP